MQRLAKRRAGLRAALDARVADLEVGRMLRMAMRFVLICSQMQVQLMQISANAGPTGHGPRKRFRMNEWPTGCVIFAVLDKHGAAADMSVRTAPA